MLGAAVAPNNATHQKVTTMKLLNALTKQQLNAIKLSAGGLIIFALGISLGRQLDANKSVSTTSAPKADTALTSELLGDSSSPPQQKADSMIKEDIDPLTDQTRYTLILNSTNDMRNSIGSLEKDSLYIRCKGSETDVYINTSDFVSSDGQTVKIRWDDGPIMTQYWGPASSGGALFSSAPISLINQIAQSKKLVISYQPYSKVAVSAVFNFEGSSDDVAKMQSVCK